MVDLASTIFRDFVTDGVPSSGPHKPQKSKIREWGGWLEARQTGTGLLYGFSPVTADADPGAGLFRMNNAAAASATLMFIDDTDAAAASAGAVIAGWDDSTNPVRGTITLRGVDESGFARTYNVTGTVVDGTGYRKVTIAHVGGSGELEDGAQYVLSFARAGDSDGDNTLVTATGSTAARNLKNRFADQLNVKDFGAVGDGVADDTAAVVAACAAGLPVFVPASISTYELTSLTEANRALLYGPGLVKVSGVYAYIPSVASPVQPSTDKPMPALGVRKRTLQPAGQSGVVGSVGRGAIYTDVKRTGGFGQYGNWLNMYTISASTVANEFDTGVTTWTTHQNLAGGSVFGLWGGANSPSSALGQTYTAGGTIGIEINAGNRWGDEGLKADVGAGRYFVGLQIVPDVIPAEDGATAAIYPGSFGTVTSASIHGHKWWVGSLVRPDAIMPGGYLNRDNGGSVVGNAALAHTKLGGFFTDFLDLESATVATDIFRSANLRLGASGLAVFGAKTQYQVNSEAGSAFAPAVQIHGAGAAATAGITRWSADANQGRFVIAKSRGAAIGTRGSVINGDILGSFIFGGDDGTNFIPGAMITARVNGTPGASDLPTDLVFGTTLDGAATPSEWMVLRSHGRLDLAGALKAQANTTIPAGGSAGAGLTLSSATNFGVFFGSGVPTLAAAKGSLYLRSDGTSTSTRMYVNTDGATAWTAVTTAA